MHQRGSMKSVNLKAFLYQISCIIPLIFNASITGNLYLFCGKISVQIVKIKDAVVSIQSDIRNAYIDFGLMTVSVVALITDVIREGKPVIGFGFNSNGRYAQQGLLRERFIPRLKTAAPETLLNEEGNNLDPEKIWTCLMKNEKPGGHGDRSVAVGVIDMAVWDAVSKIEGVPLYRYLADKFRGGKADEKVSIYAAGGYYYPGKGLESLKREMQSYLDRGYTAVKMKIGGTSLDEDLRRIETALSVVADGDNLAVDANGKFGIEKAITYAKKLEPYDLLWYEEAGDPLDYALQAELADHYEGPMATGENLFSMQDARNLVRYGGMRPNHDILQFDCALSYGLVEYMRTLEMLEENGWSRRSCIPHGGHQMCLNVAAGLGLGGNESYPDVFKPFNGFADCVPVEDGYVGFPDIPGIGIEAKNEPYKILKELVES